jgi:osmotically-inducible protein OsmY
MKIRNLALVAATALTLGACAPLLIVGAAGGGKVAAQERSLGRAFDDMGMQTDIEARFASSSLKMFRRVDVRVVEGRVLLAGRVKSEEERVQAGTLAWAVPNVREVNNELIVNSKAGVARNINDFRISQQLRAKLLADNKISAVNYSLQTVDGMVFMIGIARDESELERVALHARTIAGVKKVVSYVQLKDDPSRAQRL